MFERIGTTSKICVEFSVWDGLFLSNAAFLWKHKDSYAYINKADSTKCLDLIENFENYPKVKAINPMIGLDEHSLENILINNQLSINSIDLLSIDIVSNDIYIL